MCHLTLVRNVNLNLVVEKLKLWRKLQGLARLTGSCVGLCGSLPPFNWNLSVD